VAMPFSDATLMEQSTDPESIEESVNLPVNTNVSLRLGGNLVMVHLSPFSLILLWIVVIQQYIRRLGSSSLFYIKSDT